MITIESFSADFMAHFGNNKHLTPVLDSLAGESIFSPTCMLREPGTVRGMEALSLAVPPTPGSSIIRRPENEGLSTIGNIFLQKGYEAGFFYGGDGYFDNMDKYFGSNGFAVTDRGRNLIVKDNFVAPAITFRTSLFILKTHGVFAPKIYTMLLSGMLMPNTAQESHSMIL